MITIQQQLEAVDREVALRKRVYPKWVEAGKMTKQKMDYEIQCMMAVRDSLKFMPRDAALLKL